MGQLLIERPDERLANDAILCCEPESAGQRYLGDTGNFDNRLASYRHSPYEPTLQPRRLASAGFYWTGCRDIVTCYSCGQYVEHFVPEDNPRDQRWHRQECDEVGDDDDNERPPTLLGALLRDMRRLEQQPSENRNTHRQPAEPVQQPSSRENGEPNTSETATTSAAQETGYSDIYEAFACIEAFTPGMANLSDRARSFRSTWNANIRATPEELARAGFVYTGMHDRVRCWYCNGYLENWNHNDDPWEEHAKWFPTCEFVLRHRGPDFVYNIVSRFPNLQRPGNEPQQEPMDLPPPAQPAPPRPPAPPSVPQTPAGPRPPMQPAGSRPHAPFNSHVQSTHSTTEVLPGGYTVTYPGNAEPTRWPRRVHVFNTNGASSYTLRTRRGTTITYNFGGAGAGGSTNIVRTGRGNQRQPPRFVDPRQEEQRHESTVNQEMENSPLVATVRSMGFEDETIKLVLLSKLQAGGCMFENPDELVDALMQYQEELARIESATLSPGGGETEGTQSSSNQEEEATTSTPERELRRLEDSRNCRMCHRERATVVLMPCAHLAVCVTCSARNIRVCPVCKRFVTENIRSFMS